MKSYEKEVSEGEKRGMSKKVKQEAKQTNKNQRRKLVWRGNKNYWKRKSSKKANLLSHGLVQVKKNAKCFFSDSTDNNLEWFLSRVMNLKLKI